MSLCGFVSATANVLNVIQNNDPRRHEYINNYDIERVRLIELTRQYLRCFTLFRETEFKNLRINIININRNLVDNIDIIIRFININLNNGIPIRGNINGNLFNYHEYHLSAIDSIEWLENFMMENPNFTINNVNIKNIYFLDKTNTQTYLKDAFINTTQKFRTLRSTDEIELYDVLQNRKLSRTCSIITTVTSLFTTYGFANVSLRTSKKTKLNLIPNPLNEGIVNYINSNENVNIKHVSTERYLSYDRSIYKMLWDDTTINTRNIFNVKITTNDDIFNINRRLKNNDYVSLSIDNRYIYFPSIYNYDRYTWNHVRTGNAPTDNGRLSQIFVVRLVENNL